MRELSGDPAGLAARLDTIIRLLGSEIAPGASPKERAILMRDAGVDVEFISKVTGLTSTSIYALGVSGPKGQKTTKAKPTKKMKSRR